MVQEKIADPIFKYHRQLKHTDKGIKKKLHQKEGCKWILNILGNGLKKVAAKRDSF